MSNTSEKDSPDPVGQAFSSVRKILLELSGRDRLTVLKAVGGEFGHRVLPGLATQQVVAQGVPRVSQRPRAPSQVKSSKSAEQKKIQTEIKLLNKQISEKSRTENKELPKDDSLIVRRNQLFRAKHDKEVRSNAPDTGAGDSNAQRS